MDVPEEGDGDAHPEVPLPSANSGEASIDVVSEANEYLLEVRYHYRGL